MEGVSRVVQDADQVFDLLKKLTQDSEQANGTNWQLPVTKNAKISALLKGITAFEVHVEKIEAKFKLSQNQNAKNRVRVVEALAMGTIDQRVLSKWMCSVEK